MGEQVKQVTETRIRISRNALWGVLLACLLPTMALAVGPLDNVTPGRWYMFPNSRVDAVAPSPFNHGSFESLIFAWNSGVYDTDRDSLVLWGGGHMDSSDNAVYAFGPLSSSNPTWRRLSNPSSPPANDTSYASDGRPVSRHTYNLIDYMPAPYNKMVSCAIGSGYSSGSGWGAMDFYDFTINGMTGQPWTRGPTPPSNRWTFNAFCAYNPVTRKLWYQDTGNGQSRLQQYDPETNQWTSHATFNPDSEPTPAIDTRRNLLVSTGNLNGTILYDLNSPNSAPIRLTTTGPKGVENGKFPGFQYDPVNDRFLGWDGGSTVYSLAIPANPKTGTWVWSTISLDPGNTVTPTGVAGPKIVGYETGTYGRFRYVPAHQGVIVVNATDENVYFFKVPNTGGRPLPSIDLEANPTTVAAQGSSTLTWTTTDADSCTASGGWSGSKATSGSQSVGPLSATTTYTLTCDNGVGGTSNRSATVTVSQATPAPTVDLNANPTTVAAGSSSTLSWSSTNATSCTASGGWSGSKATSGSQATPTINVNTSFTLTCTGAGGTGADSVTVQVQTAPPAPVVNITANPATIVSGLSSTLSWTVQNATSCNASGAWSGSKNSTAGTQVVFPTATSNYTLTCNGVSATTTVTVTPAPPPPPPAPTLTFTSSAATVESGNPVTLTWTSTNATGCTASGAWSGAKAATGTEATSALTTDSTFNLSCTGTGGSVAQAVTVDVTAAAEPPPGTPSPARSGGALDWTILAALASLLALTHLVRARRFAPGASFAVLLMLAGVAQVRAADITTITLQNTSGTAQSNAPVTFGHVFKPGDVANGIGITARTSGGTTIPVQVNAKARNGDGSLRHAVLTLNVPSLGANGADVVTLATGTSDSGTAVALSSLLATSYDANVTLNVGGTAYSASARQALQSSPLTWLSGPQVGEWIARMPVRTAGGANHPHLTAYFHVRAYAGNPITRVRTDVVIENGWTMVSGSARFTYDANLSVPGGQSYTRAGIGHHGHTRWHRVLWWGTQPTIYVKHDKNYLQDSRAIPKYENITPTDSFLNSTRQSTDPMNNGDHSDNMEDTGFQEGIGPLPQWDAVYAISTDRRAFNYMLANADGGNAYSTHFRDENTGYPVTIDSYPNATLADPQASQPRIPEGGSSPFNVISSAHQPSIGFLPYIVTGDYFYLEEMQFWSSYNQIWTSLGQRGGTSGYFYDQSLRGQAWAYRSLAQAAYATPDDHALKSYFNTKLQNNITRFTQLYVSPGGPHKNNLGAMYMAEGNEQYRFYDYFMSWVVQYVVDLGFTQGIPFRDYKVKFPIGIMGMTSSEYCFQAAAQYTWRVGPSGSSTFYPDFRTMYTNTVGAVTAALPCGSSAITNALGLSRVNEMVGGQTEIGYYFANLQPALASAADSGVPGGQEAWQRSQLSGLHPDYRNSPIWAIVPRGSVQGGTISVNLAANPQTVTPGSNVTLTWTSSGADTCTASDGWAGAKAISGSQSVGPLNANTSFTLTCTNAAQQSAMSTAMVTVQAAPPAPTLALSANPTTVTSGASSTLSWSSTNATSCTASGGWSGGKAVNGSQVVNNITVATTYTLACTGTGGNVSRSVTVQVSTPPPPAIVTLTASPTSIQVGQASTLTWSTQNATSCTASGAWSGGRATSGSLSVSPTATSSYTLTCNGTAQSVTVTVTPAQPPPPDAPTLTFTASATTVDSGTPVTLTWSTTNATSCAASGSWSGAKETSGTASTGPLTSTVTFDLTCSGTTSPAASRSVTVNVTAAQTEERSKGAIDPLMLLGLALALFLLPRRRLR
jgi:hypothetical protein